MNSIHKNPVSGDWVDEFNDLYLTRDGFVHDRHGRIAPVKVTSTVCNAMRSACAAYNAAMVRK